MCYCLYWEIEALGHLGGFGEAILLTSLNEAALLPEPAFTHLARIFCPQMPSYAAARTAARSGRPMAAGSRMGWEAASSWGGAEPWRERPGSCYSHHTALLRPAVGLPVSVTGSAFPPHRVPAALFVLRPVVAEWLPSTFCRRLGATG